MPQQDRLRPPGTVGVVAQVLIGVKAVVEIVAPLVTGIGREGVDVLVRADQVLSLAAALAFVVWFGCCRTNAEVFAPGRTPYGDGMAALAWFIPVFWWWGPWRIALGIRRASGGTRGDVALINAWWIAWVARMVSLPLYRLLALYGGPNPPWFSALSAVAAALCIAVISRITAAQNAAARAAAG
ncbi:DUF4328 domain-containing protein [Kitasatospora sp. NPDC002227]|uniref:DUF4328 domain-containing protein n=1 Tax=Kitasatospora sp. NPDC002227 TaxID=3154773 RepID=UPI00332A01FE